VTTYALHPGVVNTELMKHIDATIMPGATWFFKHIIAWFTKDEEQGAATTLYCALDEKVSNVGLYVFFVGS